MSYTVRIVTDDRAFEALGDRWNGLASGAVDGSTFLTHRWLFSWWQAYHPRADLRIVTVERDGMLCGVAPMMLVNEGGLERLLRRLRFVGDGTSETDHMNFIVAREDRSVIVDLILDELERLPWQVAHFSQMREKSENTLQLMEHAARRGWLTDTAISPCPLYVFPGSPPEILKSLPSRLRTSVRSARKHLIDNHAMEFGWVTDERDLPAALQDLYRNHASRWKIKGQQGVFVDSRKRAFYEVLSSRLLGAGALRFFFLRVDGVVVAQQFCFEHGGTVELLQEGFDAAWADRNVGNVLRLMVFEHLCEAGASRYDFLAGESRHKRHWSNALENDVIVRAFRPNLVGRVARHLSNLRSRSRARDGVDNPAAS